MNVVTDKNGDWVIDNKFKMFFEKYEDGGMSGEYGDQIGWLIYENGVFFYEEIAEK